MNSLIRDALHAAWEEQSWEKYSWVVKLFLTKFAPIATGWRTKFDA
jgi:hypothetical protein